MLLDSLLRSAATAHHARAMGALEVHAVDSTTAESGRGDAVRVLLAGSGITSGWGVHTHGLALVGSLQRVLQQRLGRPVDVEQLSTMGATLADAPAVLGARASEDWDAIVLAFGLSDAMRLTRVPDWAQALGRVLAKLDGDMPRGLLVPILVVGVPPVESLGALQLLLPLRSLVGRHAERLNAVTRTAVARNRRADFVALPGMANSTRRPIGSPEAYLAWAEAIAAELVAHLPADLSRIDVEAMAQQPDGDVAAAVLAPANADVLDRLQEIVQGASARFPADLVLVNLVSGDSLWKVVDSEGGAVRSILRSATIDDAILRDGALSVPDVASDTRFSGLGLVTAAGIASYEGVALRSAGGAAIGTLSLVNGLTRGPAESAALRRFAAAAEGALARLRPGGEMPAPAPAAETSPVAAHPRPEPGPGSDPSVAPRRAGLLERRRRLRTEGLQLTETAATRSVPAESEVRVPGADPIRVLLVGGEYSVGFGSTSRSEALDGALARLLHTRTGRGVLVENRAQHLVPLHQLSASLGPAGAHTFDLVVWTPTFIEAARLLLRSRWIAGLELMLRKIETTSDASVVLVGFPSLVGNQPLAVIGRARVQQINRLLQRIAARHANVLVAEPPAIVLSEVEESDGPQVYRDAAVRILPVAMDLLDAQGCAPSAERRAAAGADRLDLVGA